MGVRIDSIAALKNGLSQIRKTNTYTDSKGNENYFLTDIGKNVKDFELNGVVNPESDQDALFMHDFECARNENGGEDDENTDPMDHKSLKVRLIFQKCGSSRMPELRSGIIDIGHAVKYCVELPAGVTSVKWINDSINVHEMNTKYGGTVYTLEINYSVPEFED